MADFFASPFDVPAPHLKRLREFSSRYTEIGVAGWHCLPVGRESNEVVHTNVRRLVRHACRDELPENSIDMVVIDAAHFSLDS